PPPRAPGARPRPRPALRDVEPPAEVAHHLGVRRVLPPLATEPLAMEPAEEPLEPERHVRRHAALVARQREEERVGLALIEGAMQRPAYVHRLAEPRADTLQERAGWRCGRHGGRGRWAGHPGGGG